MRRLIALAALTPMLLAPCHAQTPAPCDPPALRAVAAGRNIFDERQEQDLGDAIAEHLQRTFNVIDDESVNAYLEGVGRRIVAQLPPTAIRFRFALVDLPEANAFVLPGGRVYVARKLVALAETEDELAGVIAHETGHVLAKHGAIRMTRLMREVLGVTSIGDRSDVFEKYNRLVENGARNPKAMAAEDEHDDPDQLVADQLGLYAMVKAGYDPAAFSRFFDRIAETQGKTGNFFTDVFGVTSSEAKRLRTMRRTEQSIPAECAPAHKAVATDAYRVWQSAVVGYTAHGRREALHGVRSKIALDPALREEVSTLRFSPDGKYILAQDQSSVAVLTREPLAFLFRIDTPDAEPARFTPDSREIVFNTPALRVERWDVAARKQVFARELYHRAACLQTELAPDGKTLACLDEDLTLTLFDVESGAPAYQKKEFYVPNPFEMILLQIIAAGEDDADDVSLAWVNMAFSPDGRLFAAGAHGLGAGFNGPVTALSAVAVDTRTRATVPLKGQSKMLLAGGFCFIGSDRIAGTVREDVTKSGVYTFPEGKLVDVLPFNGGTPEATASSHYMLQRPAGQYPVGVLDLTTKKFFKANKQSAFDVFGEQFVSERKNGEVGLYGVEANEAISAVDLPKSPFGRLRATALSSDMSWLAASGRLRGSVWNLTTGERVFYVRAFRGAAFAPDGALYADFPKAGNDARKIVKLDVKQRIATDGMALDERGPRQLGTFVVNVKANAADGALSRDVVLDVRDVRTNSVLWSKPFAKEAPIVWARPEDGTIALAWAESSDYAKAEIKADPKLASQASAKPAPSDRLVEFFDFTSGKELGRLLVDTGQGSFTIERAFGAGDWAVVEDASHRSLVYSLATGQLKGRFFGGDAVVSLARGLVCVENEPGHLVVYDLATNERRDELTFSSPIVLARFAADGKTLFALTAAQEAYVLDVAP